METFWYLIVGFIVVVFFLCLAILSFNLELKNSGGFNPSKVLECRSECADQEFEYKEYVFKGWRDGRMECWCYDPENNRSLEIW